MGKSMVSGSDFPFNQSNDILDFLVTLLPLLRPRSSSPSLWTISRGLGPLDPGSQWMNVGMKKQKML